MDGPTLGLLPSLLPRLSRPLPCLPEQGDPDGPPLCPLRSARLSCPSPRPQPEPRPARLSLPPRPRGALLPKKVPQDNNNPTKSPVDNSVNKLCPEEHDAFLLRKASCDQQLRKLFSFQESDRMPTIGIACSGGGFRSMLSCIGIFDGLSKVGLLNCISFVAALSGGAWFLIKWFSCLSSKNPFYLEDQCDPWKIGDHTSPNSPDFTLPNAGLVSTLIEKLLAATIRLEKVDAIKAWSEFLNDMILQKDSHCSWSMVKEKLKNGDLPIPILTAITKEKTVTQSSRSWRFVDVSPFEISDGDSSSSTESFEKRNGLSIEGWLSICGSAFAIDHEHCEREGATAMVKHIKPTSSSLIESTGLVKNVSWKGSGIAVRDDERMELRDAGIHNNVPFPTLLKQSRYVDILLIIDSSDGASGNEELKKAFEQGYVKIRKEDLALLSLPFSSEEQVRIFLPPPNTKQPVLVYLLGTTSVSTFDFSYSHDLIKKILLSNSETLNDAWLQIQSVIQIVTKDLNSEIFHDLGGFVSPGQRSKKVYDPFLRNQLRTLFREKYKMMDLMSRGSLKKFSDMYTTLNVVYREEGKLSHGSSLTLESIWNIADQQKTTRVAIEADAGCGKSSLCKNCAREQLWDDRFSCVVMIELNTLRHLASFDILPILKENEFPDNCISLILQDPYSILWIWDGYDEVDRNQTKPFQIFLNHLAKGTLKWSPNSILTSRHERTVPFQRCASFVLQPWNENQVTEYLDNFFEKGDLRGLKKKSRTILDNMEITPLLCELVCHVVDEKTDPTIGEAMVYQTVVDLFWERCREKFHEISTNVVDAAKHRLGELSLEVAFTSKELPLSISCPGGKPDNPADFAIYKSGLVSEFGSKLHGKAKCKFIHNSFLEYHTAERLKMKTGDQFLTELRERLPFTSGSRQVLIFLSSFLKNDVERSKSLITYLVESTSKLENQYSSTLIQNLGSGSTYASRTHCRDLIGVDLYVESVSILGDNATNDFMNAIAPRRLNFAAITPATWLKTLSPFRYRLMVESAARFGNIVILERLCKNSGVDQDELDAAHVAAFTHLKRKRKRDDVSTFLVKKGAKPVSLTLCCQMEDLEIVKHRLSHPLDEGDIKSVFFSKTIPTRIMQAVLDHPKCFSIVKRMEKRGLPHLLLVDMFDSLRINNPQDVKLLSKIIGTNTSIKSLCLSGCLQSSSLRELCKSFETNTALTSLSLQWNQINDQDIAILSKSLPKRIASLDISATPIGLAGMVALSNALSINRSITSLQISHVRLSLKALSKSIESLTSLTLSGNKIGQQSWAQLCQSLQTNSSITSLNLSWNKGLNNLGDLCKSLLLNSSLTSLDLSRTDCDDSIATELSMLLLVKRNIKELILHWNPITDKGATALIKALEIKKPDFRCLDLGLSSTTPQFRKTHQSNPSVRF